MEAMKKKWNSLSLRRFLVLTVLLSAGIVVLLSALIIGGCAAFRHWLLPEPDALYLTIEETRSDGTTGKSSYRLKFGEELSSLPYSRIKDVTDGVIQNRYSVQRLEQGVESLTPKRKLAYQVCGIIMFAAPAILAFAAIFLCSMFFYRYKLKKPLFLLADAARKIAEQNLDFEIVYACGDEMGELCRSFDKMRAVLYENHKAMWNMFEERRLMQASVAHDLRNPIAIIEGYAEYLETGLKNGNISQEKTAHIVKKLGVAAKRLEQYTESVRRLNQSEEMQPDRVTVSVKKLAHDITEDLALLTKQSGITLRVTEDLPQQEIQVDTVLLHRILENIVNNARRYARQEIELAFSLTGRVLMVTVTDDGAGFPPEVLNRTGNTLLIAGKDGHMGIGLPISRLLCEKHGGSLELSNVAGGACVKFSLLV